MGNCYKLKGRVIAFNEKKRRKAENQLSRYSTDKSQEKNGKLNPKKTKG